MKNALLAAALLIGLAGITHAHSGNTDYLGCHIDHKTGIKHCH